METLADSEVKKEIGESRGFYLLKGREELADHRILCNKIAIRKIKKLQPIVRILRFIPFVKMIGITGKLAMKMPNKDSDWDVLVITKKGRIWTGRTLITLFLHLLGKRRHGKKIKDRICLNHFITDESLKVSTKSVSFFFSAHEYFSLLPIFDTGVFNKFQLKNSWIKNCKPNYHLTEINNLKLIKDTKLSEFIRSIGEKLFGWSSLENWLRKWQKKKIMNNPKTHLKGSFIKASDDALVFLPEPHEPKLVEHLRQKTGMLIS